MIFVLLAIFAICFAGYLWYQYIEEKEEIARQERKRTEALFFNEIKESFVKFFGYPSNETHYTGYSLADYYGDYDHRYELVIDPLDRTAVAIINIFNKTPENGKFNFFYENSYQLKYWLIRKDIYIYREQGWEKILSRDRKEVINDIRFWLGDIFEGDSPETFSYTDPSAADLVEMDLCERCSGRYAKIVAQKVGKRIRFSLDD